MTVETPFERYRDIVRQEWIDRNGHMNIGFYSLVFDLATDAFMFWIGLDLDHREKYGVTTMALESHMTYQREVIEGAPLLFTTQLLDFDAKRIHYFHRMIHAEEGFVAATSELLSLHLDTDKRRSMAMDDRILKRLEVILQAHTSLSSPSEVGRVVGLHSTSTTRQ